MIKIAATLCCLALLMQSTLADIYLQNPRGSNNRLNSKNVNRRNNNRMFDSQNNAKGGYNVGVMNENNDQYQMKYYAGSHMRVEWTHQHGCGYSEDGTTQINCNVVLSYMCQKSDGSTIENPLNEKIRDGKNEKTINPRNPTPKEGLNEPVEWYKDCAARSRNMGLFTADQNMKNRKKARNTRQNRNGQRYGTECPEERDYWPYWHSSPWNDIAYIASDNQNGRSSCPDMAQSSNLVGRQVCASFDQNGLRSQRAPMENTKAACEAARRGIYSWITTYQYDDKYPQHTTKPACLAAGGHWGLPWNFKTNRSECLRLALKPACVRAQRTRENHLGNHLEDENHGTNNFDWKLPAFLDNEPRTCVLRARYNISSNSYPATADVRDNRKNGILQDPTVQVAGVNLKLNLNTNQVGRTFQDRSHTFQILPRAGSGLRNSDNVYNLNVRGKRGNIVQVYPAVEYDFSPQHLALNSSNDVVHIQWTGSNTNSQGKDRNNFLLTTLNSDFPVDFKKTTFLKRISQFRFLNEEDGSALPQQFSRNDLAVYLATGGGYKTVSSNKNQLGVKLQQSSASFAGSWLRFKPGGQTRYNTFCSVNNDFSNRRQLGVIDLNF